MAAGKLRSGIKQWGKNESVRNISTLVAGTGIAQALLLAASPVLSRIFTPADFGLWALFVSFTSVFGVIAAFRYEMAIVLPKSDDDARSVFWISLLATSFTGIFLLILLLLFGSAISVRLGMEELENWLYLTPLAVILMGFYNSFNYWTTRHRRFKLNSSARISQSGMNAGLSLGVGSFIKGPAGLILGQVVGMGAAVLVFAISTFRRYPLLRKIPEHSQLKSMARKYRNFPRVNTPHAFVSTLQDSGIVFVIKYFFETGVLGAYSFAFRVLKAPVGLIGSAVFQVFFERASKASAGGGNLRPLMWKLVRTLFLIGFVPFLILFLIAPDLFAFVFSEPYRQAGEIAKVFTPWLFLNFIMSPLSSITLIKNRQKTAFGITLTDVVFRVAAIAYGGISGDYMLAFTLMSISCSILLIGAMGWYFYIAGSSGADAYETDNV